MELATTVDRPRKQATKCTAAFGLADGQGSTATNYDESDEILLPNPSRLTMKVARSALHISLSLWERVGVRETIMAPATYIFRGGAGAMIVSDKRIALMLSVTPAKKNNPSPQGE
jgi:hypothetical protein